MKCPTGGLQTVSQRKVKFMRTRKSKQVMCELDRKGSKDTPGKENNMC